VVEPDEDGEWEIEVDGDEISRSKVVTVLQKAGNQVEIKLPQDRRKRC
jgi:hypothetical protein